MKQMKEEINLSNHIIPRLQIHTGNTTLERVLPVLNDMQKPEGGLWTCNYRPNEEYASRWIEFCHDNDFYVPEHQWEGIILEVDPDARIYVIDSYEDLEKLITLFRAHDPYENIPDMRNLGAYKYPNYEKIAEHFDAVHLTDNGQCETRLSRPYNLYGWDFESTVWFRQKFKFVSTIFVPVKQTVED